MACKCSLDDSSFVNLTKYVEKNEAVLKLQIIFLAGIAGWVDENHGKHTAFPA